MKFVCLILGYLFYLVEGQLGFLPNIGSNINNLVTRENTTNLINLPVVSDLEKLFLQDWLDFEKKFVKNYDEIEAPIRKANFLQNINTITNLAAATGENALKFGLKINEYADMLFDEFNQLFNGFNRDGQLQSHIESSKTEKYSAPLGAILTKNVDWREKGTVTSVKNQQKCAGCWAFSVAAALESHIAIKNGTLQDLSTQHLIDCATGKYNNSGCIGGYTHSGFIFIQENGINSYTDYPYEAINGTCRSRGNNIAARCQGYIRIKKGDEGSLAKAVSNLGPISAAMHVTSNFQFYGDKVFDDPKCGNRVNNLNHAVLVVGYGEETDGTKYWLVKNSYGTSWGLDGYFKLAKDSGNKCGIATFATYPIM